MIIDLLLLTLIIVFIIDLSGFTDSLRTLFSKIISRYIGLNINPDAVKLPFVSCSLCTVWWTGLLYLIITSNFTLVNITLVALLSYLTSNIAGFLGLIKEILIKIENYIYKII